MLNDDQVAALRARVEAQSRAGEGVPMSCRGGPLDGLMWRVPAYMATRGDGIVGLSTPTANGPIVANYELADDDLRWKGYDAPGRRESGG